MADAITDFLQRLGRNEVRTTDYLPESVRGSVRLDLEDGGRTDHWLVTLDRGTARVEHIDQEADAVMRGPRSLFDRLAGGEDTLVAALFRNDIVVEGDLGLVDLLARLFPGPTSAHHPREFARRGNPDA